MPLQLIGIVLTLSISGIHTVVGQVIPIPIHELTDSMRLNPKPALILISTDWCTYCAMQKAQLKKNKRFQDVATLFHFSELDAETKAPIGFGGKTYRFVATGNATGTHELAHELGTVANRLAYPTWVLIDEKFEIHQQYPGILTAKALDVLADGLTETTDKQ